MLDAGLIEWYVMLFGMRCVGSMTAHHICIDLQLQSYKVRRG
jgi:hypothetical protein